MADNFLGNWLGGRRPASSAVREAQAELERLAADRPELAALARCWRELLPDLQPDAAGLAVPELDRDRARARLNAGTPLLRGETLTVPGKVLRRRWHALCAVLQAHRGDGTAAALEQAASRGRLDLAELVHAALAGQPQIVHERALALGLDAGLTATVLRLVLFPTLTALETVLAWPCPGLAWERGYCPRCGSWPLLAEFRGLDQTRFLRCGLCAADWQAPRLWCPYCGNRDHHRLLFLHAEGEELTCQAAVCEECRGYVKTVATLAALPPLRLLVADVATLHLDLAAAQRGYTNAL